MAGLSGFKQSWKLVPPTYIREQKLSCKMSQHRKLVKFLQIFADYERAHIELPCIHILGLLCVF